MTNIQHTDAARTFQFYPNDPAANITINVRSGRANRRGPFGGARPLENATLNFSLQNANGSLVPLSVTTNDRGMAQIQFTPHTAVGYNRMDVTFSHADFDPARTPPIIPFPIQTGTINPAPDLTTNPVSPLTVQEGRDLNFNVELVQSGTGTNGENLDGTSVDVVVASTVAGQAAPPAIMGINTVGGVVGTPSRAPITVAGLTTAGSPYQFSIRARSPGSFQNPGNINGIINVTNQPNLDVTLDPNPNYNYLADEDKFVVVHVRRSPGGSGVFASPVPIQVRFPRNPAIATLSGQAISGTPTTPAAIRIGPIPGLDATTVDNAGGAPGVYQIEVIAPTPPAGYRSPALPTGGTITVTDPARTNLDIQIEPLSIREDQDGFVTVRVVEAGTTNGVNCEVQITSRHPEIGNKPVGQASGGGPGVPAVYNLPARHRIPRNTLSARFTGSSTGVA
ncbi:MAG: hypothetical protein QF535_22835, partial [Anaerolineales bacterium]|nr:hypothetical protein [Anaerolineales bacterium]